MRKILLSFIAVLLLTSCATQETTTVSQAVLSESEPTEFVIPVLIIPKASASAGDSTKETPPEKVASVKEVTPHKLLQMQKHMVKYGLSEGTANKYAKYINVSATKYDIDPYLILAIIQVETGRTFKFKSHPNSHGAIGLMQILKRNAKWMGVSISALYDPQTNINLGTKYLKQLQNRFGYDKGIVAYNQGEGNVSRGTYNTRYLKEVKAAYATIQK